jgi:uncharacterized protein YceK
MIYKKIVIGIVLTVLTGCSSVQGVVKDRETSSPISSATVMVTRTQNSTVTDAVGHYSLTGMFIPGDTLMINAPSYNISTQTLKSSQNYIDIELVPKN